MPVGTRFAALVAIVVACGGVLGYSIIQEISKNSAAEQASAPMDPETQKRNQTARRDHIARQVASGRLGLLNAAAQLRDSGLVSCCQLESEYSQSVEDKLCRDVIQLAVATVKDPSAAETLQQRLEKELGDAADAEGRIALPSPAPVPEMRRAIPVVDVIID